MRSSVKAVTALLVLAAAMPLLAQSSQAQRLYTDALEREGVLRKELESPDASPALLIRIRALVGAYEDMSRLFPGSGYSDNALWQGGRLAADAFWRFGEAVDRSTSMRLLTGLRARFPSSSLVRQVPDQLKRLNAATPSASPPASPVATASATTIPAAPPPPVVTPSRSRPSTSGVAPLTAIRREVLPEVLRITMELGREVTFYDEQIGGPPRVFIDLQNTRAVETLRDAVIPYADDLVKQVRIGRQADARTRVVLDLRGSGAGRYSIYTLYDPYRIVVDFERMGPARDPVVARNTVPVAAAVPTPVPELRVSPATDAAPPVVQTKPATLETVPAPADAPATLAAPLPPSANRNGSFSLSRQLGLGIAKVVIDAGHGGHDPGAQARGITEADLVLDVALRLEKLLVKEGGFEVVLTRRTDTFVSLEERTAIANRAGADLFLSVHANASSNATARGIETYFLNFASNPEAEAVAARENAGGSQTMRKLPEILKAIALNNKIDESRDFAAMVQNSMYMQMRKSNRELRNLGVKQAPFMVLVGATMPSILAEISFITNKQEAALLKGDKYRQQIAEALLAGVQRYQHSLKRAPVIATR